jgi:hypothetical protein
MIKDHHYTCAHPACACRVTPPSLFCADACRQQAEADVPRDAAPCSCGHDACIPRRIPAVDAP